MANPQHSSSSSDHFTPEYVIEAVRETFDGTISLDPASNANANKLIKARRIYTKRDDGLTKPWRAKTVFVNPPGGTVVVKGSGTKRKQSSSRLWWEKAVAEYTAGRAHSIIFVAFSLELFQRGQANVACDDAPHMFPFCIPKRRIPFDTWDRGRVKGAQPTHANAIILLAPPDQSMWFERAFESIGPVRL